MLGLNNLTIQENPQSSEKCNELLGEVPRVPFQMPSLGGWNERYPLKEIWAENKFNPWHAMTIVCTEESSEKVRDGRGEQAGEGSEGWDRSQTLEGARVIRQLRKQGKVLCWKAVWKGNKAFKNTVSTNPEAVHYFRTTQGKFIVKVKKDLIILVFLTSYDKELELFHMNQCFSNLSSIKPLEDFPGGPVVKTPSF